MRRYALFLLLLACEPERATVRITDASVVRDDQRRLVVDVDVEAHEGLGKNLGRYCVSIQWPGETDYLDRCDTDLEDGDTKTVRFVSEREDYVIGALIRVRAFTSVQTGGVDLNAPP